jgi:hypothetical protein
MKPRTARLLLWLYPRSWRERYGEEFAALLAQQRLTLDEVVDVARGAYDAHRTALRRRGARREERKMARRQRGMHCSFCGKDQDQARRLIAGPNRVYICDECIALCNDILSNDPAPQASFGTVTYGTLADASAPWWRRLSKRWQARRHRALGQVVDVPCSSTITN